MTRARPATPGPIAPCLTALGLVALLAAGCTSGAGGQGGPASRAEAPSTTTAPGLSVQQVVGGLDHGWDIGFLPDGKVLLTERPGRLTLLDGSAPGANRSNVDADFADLHARGEGGLMGLVVHPDFAASRRFTTCQSHWENDKAVDIRLVTWELAADYRSARRVRAAVS